MGFRGRLAARDNRPAGGQAPVCAPIKPHPLPAGPRAPAPHAAAGAGAAALRGVQAASPSAADAGPLQFVRRWACAPQGQARRQQVSGPQGLAGRLLVAWQNKCHPPRPPAEQHLTRKTGQAMSRPGYRARTGRHTTAATTTHCSWSAPLGGIVTPAALHEVLQRGRAVLRWLGPLLVLRHLQDDLHGRQAGVQLCAAGHNLPHCGQTGVNKGKS